MFRKIVSNLPFSPALVGQLGFYVKRLRKEEATRKLSLIFVILALIVQSLIVFQPSESANAASANRTAPKDVSQSINSLIKTKTATNISQGFIDASLVTARAGDQISYTITVENTGINTISSKLEDELADVLEYSTLNDNGGGVLDQKTHILSWPDITLNPKDKQNRTFTVKLFETIPATARGENNNTSSYDCVMTNAFGNTTNIKLACPAPKIIEKISTDLPKIGISENILFAFIIVTVTAFLYARTRQFKKELYLIRSIINTDII
ncbi:MAG: hypothetical protein WCJ36_03545 [Candidatus Saccharibacteria bacterium]